MGSRHTPSARAAGFATRIAWRGPGHRPTRLRPGRGRRCRTGPATKWGEGEGRRCDRAEAWDSACCVLWGATRAGASLARVSGDFPGVFFRHHLEQFTIDPGPLVFPPLGFGLRLDALDL